MQPRFLWMRWPPPSPVGLLVDYLEIVIYRNSFTKNMRAQISVKKTSGMPLGYDYQYWLASMLLDRLGKADGDLADFMHTHTGYNPSLTVRDKRCS